MPETLGARLRIQRERQQVSLATIAEHTKIKMSLLEELERDDASHWPSGIFRRSFIRAYARAIGLDPDSVVREFLEVHPDPEENVVTAMSTLAEGGSYRRPPTRLRCLIESAIGAVSTRRAQQAAATEPQLSTRVITPAEPLPSVEAVREPVPPPIVAAAGEPAPQELEPVIPPAPVAHEQANLSGVAHLCTRLARVLDIAELPPLLDESVRVLDAVGVIVWVWEPVLMALTPMISSGYSDAVLARMPAVRRDADNAIAAAFRSGETRTVCGDANATGAIVAPLMTPGRCMGVLAIEVRGGAEQCEPMRALATILAAQLVALLGPVPLAEAVNA